MTGPQLLASYDVDSAGDNTTALVTSAFIPSDNEVIVVKGTTWAASETLSTPVGGALTFAPLATIAPAGFAGYGAIWAVELGTSPGSMTVTVSPATSSRHHMVVERWGNAQLAPVPASGTGWYSGSPGKPQVAITTQADNSVVTWCAVDVQSVDPATRSYLMSAIQDGLFDGHVGANSVMYFAYATAATAGTYTMGLDAPDLQKWAMAGVEIQAAVTEVFGGRLAPSLGGPQTPSTLGGARESTTVGGPRLSPALG